MTICGIYAAFYFLCSKSKLCVNWSFSHTRKDWGGKWKK